MPLRAPSELLGSLHIFVSSFDDGLDEDDDVFPPLSLTLPILWIFEFFVVEIFVFLFFIDL